MITRVLEGTRELFEHIFPERQIYHRSHGEVRYISLSSRTQILASAVACALVLWVLYTSASVFLSGHLLSSQTQHAFASRMHFQRLVAEARAKEASTQALLESRTIAFSTAAGELEARLNTLKILLENSDQSVLDTYLEDDSNLEDNTISSQLMISAVAEDNTPRQSRTQLAANTTHALADADPFARLNSLKEKSNQLLISAEEHTESRIEGLNAVLAMTGLNVDDIMAQDNRNIGGPLIALDENQLFGEALAMDQNFVRRVTRLTGRLAKTDQLQSIVLETPLGQPVLVPHRRTSGFGTRVDPITHRPAHHAGQDFGAYRLAPISATAGGTVTYAGWRSGYGRLVEIDHGLGFKTRYGHMAKILVKRGQTVKTGEQIGSMGSSGRSTGVHLHYEVWFKGKPYNPQNFLKAGLYVQKR